MNRVLIIAEAGVNHNGDINIAKKMVDVAKECGADIIKFQTALPEEMISRQAPKARYQIENTGMSESQLAMIKKLTLSYCEFEILSKYCWEKEIVFLSTPFDIPSIRFLRKFNMPFWKLPSGEITNYPYLCEIGKTGMEVVLSTGMSDLEEIKDAIRVLKVNGCPNVRLLHCNTSYPTPFRDVNLRVLKTLKDEFGIEVGYSDHTPGIEVPIAAVALGAAIIEKHFTLDRNMEGPDHKASLEPDELCEMVSKIRNIEQALGREEKLITDSERVNRDIARKSIVARCAIKKGEVLTEENITTKRPGNGINPMKWPQIIGTCAKRDFVEDELIEE